MDEHFIGDLQIRPEGHSIAVAKLDKLGDATSVIVEIGHLHHDLNRISLRLEKHQLRRQPRRHAVLVRTNLANHRQQFASIGWRPISLRAQQERCCARLAC